MSWSIEVHVWHILNTKDDEVIVINLILISKISFVIKIFFLYVVFVSSL